MANKFTPPASFTHNGTRYIFQYESNRNKKNELMSETCYYYKIDNKGEALPFARSQIIWMGGYFLTLKNKRLIYEMD